LKIEYNYTFGLPRNIVWRYIKDEKILKNSLPGCRTFIENLNGIYQAEIEMSLGPIKDLIVLEVQREIEKSPSYYHLVMKGKGKFGEMAGKADLYINDVQGTSEVNFLGEVEVTGKIALVGKRLLEGGANKSLEKFFETVEKEMKRKIYQVKKGK
jgi:uncharacterized protein